MWWGEGGCGGQRGHPLFVALHLPSRASRDEGGDGITGVPGQEWSVVPAPSDRRTWIYPLTTFPDTPRWVAPHSLELHEKNEQAAVGGLTDLLVPHGRPEQTKLTTKTRQHTTHSRVVGGGWVRGAEGSSFVLCTAPAFKGESG